MVDVYVNDRNGLLVVAQGHGVPTGEAGSWRKKRTVRDVSNERLARNVDLKG